MLEAIKLLIKFFTNPGVLLAIALGIGSRPARR